MDRRPALLLLRDAPPFLSGEDVQQASSFEVLPGLLSLSSKFVFNTINFTVIVIYPCRGVPSATRGTDATATPTRCRQLHCCCVPPLFQCVCWGGRSAGLVVQGPAGASILPPIALTSGHPVLMLTA